MKDWIIWVICVLLALCFMQNILLSKRIAKVYLDTQEIYKFLLEGTCD